MAHAQTPNRNKLNPVVEAYKNALLKRDYNLMIGHTDASFVAGKFKKPQVDKAIPQVLAQIPKLIGLEIKETSQVGETVEATIVYEVEGHLFGTNKYTSKLVLSKDYKITKSEYFDMYLKNANSGHGGGHGGSH